MTKRVCDCPEAYGCYAEGYAQVRDKAYFEMNNFDSTQHAKGCACEGCTAFGKVEVKTLENMATGDESGGPAGRISPLVLVDGKPWNREVSLRERPICSVGA